MTFEEARQKIFSAVMNMSSTLFTTDDIIFPNQPQPDLNKRMKTPFVQVEVNYTHAKQTALASSNAPARYFGRLVLTYFTPINSGSKPQSEFIDLVIANFQLKNIGGVVFSTPEPMKPVDGLDWAFISVSTQIYFDSIT